MKNPLFELCDMGQSVWYDNISRDLLDNGGLQRLIDDFAVRGVTSNPTIFAKAIDTSSHYDRDVAENAHEGAEAVFWKLARDDIRHAADLLRPIYDASGGTDGFVSLEVSPSLGYDTKGTITAAAENYGAVDRENLLIKIPGTKEGLPAIEESIANGVSVNVTLLFSVDRHMEAADAYIAGLERARASGRDVSKLNSVASFFVSRVDTLVDKELEAIGTDAALALRGKAAVANAKIAYEKFKAKFSGDRWAALSSAGANVQRPLWASTSTKNPAYRDTIYVEELIGKRTVNTMPQVTIDAFADHGAARPTLDEDVDAAHALMDQLGEIGIDYTAVTQQLEREGVDSFDKSFGELLQTITKKESLLLQGS